MTELSSPEGDAAMTELPPYVIERVRSEDIVTIMEVMEDPNPVHVDRRLVEELGLRGPVNQGPANLGYVLNMFIEWAGHPGAIRDVRVRFEAISCPDDRLIARAHVESAAQTDDGMLATCPFSLARDTGERILSGTALVIAPEGFDAAG